MSDVSATEAPNLTRDIQRIDNAATAGIYLAGMLSDRLDGQDAHEDDLQLVMAIEALLQRIEGLVEAILA